MNLVWQPIVGKPLKKETSKTLRSWLGLPLTLNFLFSSFQQWLSPKYGENMVDLMKQYLPMDGYWMKALYSRCSFHVGIAICWNKLLQKQLTSSCWIYLGKISWLNLVSSAVVSHFCSNLLWTWSDQIDESCSSRSGGPRRRWGEDILKWLIERKFQRKH